MHIILHNYPFQCEEWFNIDVWPMMGVWGMFLGCYWTEMEVMTGFLFFLGKNDPKTHNPA